MLDSSDWLSEVYIRVVERDLVRRGLPVWRYNDDFRIGCTSYNDALAAIELLAEAARGVGLVISDQKTLTPSFLTYMFNNTGVQIDEATAAVAPGDVEVNVTDYPAEDEEDSVQEAVRTLARLDRPNGDDRIDLKSTSRRDVRDLRRAITLLTRRSDPSGLDRVTHLFLFVPSLTPRLGEYLISLYETHSDGVEKAWDYLSERDSLSEWQLIWLVYVARKCQLMTASSRRQDHVIKLRMLAKNPALRAECAFALAGAGRIGFADLDDALRVEPEVLSAWYILAMRALAQSPRPPLPGQLAAVSQTDPVFRYLLET